MEPYKKSGTVLDSLCLPVQKSGTVLDFICLPALCSAISQRQEVWLPQL